jgi:hypothetical protein
MEPRKRLKKLKSQAPPAPPSGLIPKKSNLPVSENFIAKSNDDEDDSLEDFISDRIEFDRNGPPTSSEESAHSTDEENHMRKKKKVKVSSSEESARSSDSESKKASSEGLSSSEEPGMSPKEILVGKKALEAKRQQGLLPVVKQKKPEKRSEDKPKKQKKQKAIKESVEKTKEKPKKQKNKDPKKYVQFGEFSEKERKKAELVTKILQRWWYALEDWPPSDFNYAEALGRKRLRLVAKENWSVEPTINDQGLEKVMSLPGYPGVYLSSTGDVKDMRPQESCPSFDNLFRKPFAELREILAKALNNQIEQLKIQPKADRDLLKDLTKELAYYQRQI